MKATMTETINMIEHLTSQELTKLRKLVLGYGRLRHNASKAGVHENTLRNITRNGYGMSDSIKKVREGLLGYGSNKAA
jgi:hypothetical protein